MVKHIIGKVLQNLCESDKLSLDLSSKNEKEFSVDDLLSMIYWIANKNTRATIFPVILR